MLAILHVVDMWRPYLLGQCFQIKIDHQCFKYFLEQRLSSLEQQKWVTNLFGYDYEIIYKKGKDNVVADAPFENMKMKDPFFLSPSLYQTDSKSFTRNGYTIQKFCI